MNIQCPNVVRLSKLQRALARWTVKKKTSTLVALNVAKAIIVIHLFTDLKVGAIESISANLTVLGTRGGLTNLL